MGTYNLILEALQDRLVIARQQLGCAEMIDDARRRNVEMARCRDQVEVLEAEIASAEAQNEFAPDEDDVLSMFGSGPVPIGQREES